MLEMSFGGRSLTMFRLKAQRAILSTQYIIPPSILKAMSVTAPEKTF